MKLNLDGPDQVVIGSADLCRLLGVSKDTLSSLVASGVAKRVAHGSYAIETVADYCQHLRSERDANKGKTLTESRTRLSELKADEQEMKNAVLRSELVSAADVEREWTGILSTVRSRMLSLPPRVGQALGLSRSDVAKIDREVRLALTELANSTREHEHE